MKENLKYYGKLSLIGLFTYVKIYALTILSTIVAFIVGSRYLYDIFQIISEGQPAVSGAHVSGQLGLLQIFTVRPLESILLALIFPCAILMIVMGGRYVFKKLASKIVHERSEDLILPAVDGLMNLAKSTFHEPIVKLSQATGLKKQLILLAKKQPQNRWVKKAIVYGLKKANLEDVDFSEGSVDIYSNLKGKAISKIQSMVAPSRSGFWWAITAQWTCVLIIYISFRMLLRG